MRSYLKSCKTEFWGRVFERELNYLLGVLGDYKEILSIGCGPAIIERGLQAEGFTVTGLDISEEALEGVPDNIRTVVGSAENMDFADSSFDSVIYVASLQFIDNYRKAIRETARVLRRKGRLVTMLVNPESVFFKDKRKQTNSYLNKIKYLNLGEIESVISQCFSIEKAEYFLGIKDKEIFSSNDPKIAALYVINGMKK